VHVAGIDRRALHDHEGNEPEWNLIGKAETQRPGDGPPLFVREAVSSVGSAADFNAESFNMLLAQYNNAKRRRASAHLVFDGSKSFQDRTPGEMAERLSEIEREISTAENELEESRKYLRRELKRMTRNLNQEEAIAPPITLQGCTNMCGEVYNNISIHLQRWRQYLGFALLFFGLVHGTFDPDIAVHLNP